MGLAGISEYTFMEFYHVREPYIRRLLIKRSAGILLLTFVIGEFFLHARLSYR